MLITILVTNSAVTAVILYILGRILLPEIGLESPGLGPLLVACGLWYSVQLLRTLAVAALESRS